MAIIDEALVLSDGAGHTNVIDCGNRPLNASGTAYADGAKPTGGYNNISGWLNIRTTGTQGSVKLQESADNNTYSDVAGGTVAFVHSGSVAIVLPATTKRYLKVVFSSASGDDLSSFNTCVWVGGLSEAKELA